MNNHKVGVLVSGRGSNLQAIMDKIAEGVLPLEIAVVISDKADAFALERAEKAGIPNFAVVRKECADKKEFEAKIEAFFSYIHTEEVGKRLVAKIKDDGTAFSQEEIYQDFAKVYRKYTILNKDLGDFFKRETKDSLNQLCDDFEKTLTP